MGALRQAFCAAGLVGLVTLAGCSVRVNKDDGGKDKDVSIQVPFGGLQVHKSDHGAVNTGLPTYPGATLDPGKKDDDKSLDLQMGFGPWQMHVQVASYLSSDPPDKVQAFYRKALAEYGDVLTCRGNQPVGVPVRTQDGLTCSDNDEGKHVHVSHDAGVELKAGSERRQHIVTFDRKSEPVTHFALVSLTLPSKESTGDHTADRGKGKQEDSEE